MNWIEPWWIGSQLLVIPVALAVIAGSWWHHRKLREVFGPELLRRVLPRGVRNRRRIRDLFALVCLLLGCIALAEPAFDKEIVQVKTTGVDLVLAVDLSRSMDAQDIDPSRLERARREIIDLLGLLTGDRVGVVFFAGEAYPRLPMTEDYRAVEWVLEEADTEMFKSQGSALGKAIDVGRELLSRDEGKAGKAMIVFSDGETHDPEDAARAAREAKGEGVVVYAVGIGEDEVPIPTADRGFLRHEGKQVMTKPDFETMREVARITGGGFVNSVPSAIDMEDLYRNAIRGSLRAVERDTQQTEKWKTAYQYPLGLGLGLWLLGAWLGEGRRRFGAAAAVLLALGLAPGVASATTLEEADSMFREGKFMAAEKALEQLALESPGDAGLYERLGAARYRQGQWLGAAQAYEQASRLRGGDADDDYAAGNARYRAGQLEEAIARYERALAQRPSHERAQQNKDLVEGELVIRREEKPPPPPQQGDSQDEEGKGEGESDDPSDSPSEGTDQQEGSDQGAEEGDPDSNNDADSQSGDPSQGESDAEPKDGDGSAENPSQQQSDDGQPEEGSDAVNPEDLDEGEGDQGDPQDGAAGDPSGIGEESGNITPAQASRMLDGVEEGRQRVRISGRSSEKPW
ncbi:MAG: VWA domain-containing protein [Alphaproteobacteria bacterium]|nr:VWA domain-containing protein [Alphaproteobacteria bacterium]